MQGREVTPPLFIEDITALTILNRTKEYSLGKDKQGQYFLLIDHLALPIDAKLINIENNQFIDAASEDAKRRQLLATYNPFQPGKYQHVALSRTEPTPLQYSVYKCETNPILHTYEFYAIDNYFPWIGINLTARYGLKLLESRFGKELQYEANTQETKRRISQFHDDFQQFKNSINISPVLQQKIIVITQEHKEHVQQLNAETKAREKRNKIIYQIQETNEYRDFIQYLVVLNAGDAASKEKANVFGAFFKLLNRDMLADTFDDWLRDANNFSTKFSKNFTPRPSFFGTAAKPEDTTCYKKFEALKSIIMGILQTYKYSISEAQPVYQPPVP